MRFRCAHHLPAFHAIPGMERNMMWQVEMPDLEEMISDKSPGMNIWESDSFISV